MAEKKGVGHAYNIDFLNVVFAASSIFLLLSTVWMVWDDFDRDWKNTQRRFAQLQYDVTKAQYQAARRGVDRGKLQSLQAQLKASEQNVKANQSKVDGLQKKLEDVEIRLDRASRDYQYIKATYDHDRYDFESARAAGLAGATKKGENVADEAKQLKDADLLVQKLTAERAAATKNLSQYTGIVTTTQKALEELRAEQIRLRKVAEAQAPSLSKDYFLNAPLIDFLAPTIKINQLILPDVVDDVNFKTVPKMDRCTTCHLGIDNVAFQKYPQPFKTHPNLDAYLGGKSPHPIDRVGCTVCHDGMGQSVSFKDASHTPTGEKQKELWEKKYHWEEPHEWDYPMLPTKMTEASCEKCHKQEIYVPKAPTLTLAYATFERAGCYACHKTRGFDTSTMKKPGPILTRIDAKLSKEWVKTWIRNPRAVKQTTWMPRIWYNSNSSSPTDAVRNEVEINAAVNYLFANSEKWEPPVKNPARGDAKAGEKIVKSIGCQGCHVVGEGSREEAGPHRTFGQPLENIGAKTTYEWVFNWVRDPKHYNPNTYMPNLRLTDAQAADVATYLMTLKGSGGDEPKATYTQKDVDDTLLDYFANVMPAEDAKAALTKLDADAKQIDLGKRVITRYGCFSCHDIKGFEKTQAIGTDLSEEGSKLVTRLDFGFVTDIPHTSKLGWFNRKLHNPREFDKGRVLQPLDKARMPNFDLSDVEIERLMTAIMSFQRDTQPMQAFPPKSAVADYRVAGRTIVHRRNCVGCHIIEDDGGDFLKLVADSSLGPPRLTPEGVRVQPDWLYAFLRGPIQIRPWLDVRMPTFGLDDPNLNGVIHYFQAVSNTLQPFRTYDAVASDNAAGKALFDKLQCQKCHVLGTIPKDQPTSNLAPDLRMVHERLNPDWLLPWLKNPASFLPGTRMTQFWPDYPKSPYPDLGGDADAQMRAVIAHMQSLRGGPSPRRSSGSVATN
jgi:mono/diheme cytochrome c family protein